MRNLKATLEALDRTPLFGWGKFRWFEGLIPVYYAYERTGEAWLLDLARKLHAQGFDYMDVLPGRGRDRRRRRAAVFGVGQTRRQHRHGPEGLRAVLADHEAGAERAFPARMLEILDRYHGQVTGMFTGDECLAGKNPVQGTELCAVVETMYSLEHLLTVTGDPAFGDRLERMAFNALPATFAPGHVVAPVRPAGQPGAVHDQPGPHVDTNGPESNLFGLEPNFGCCTANMHQGWPKFAAHLWMRTPDEGIAAVAYAPSTARFEVRGMPVRTSLETDYPFRETLKVTVTAEKGVQFPARPARPGLGRRCHGSRRWRLGRTTQAGIVPPDRADVGRRVSWSTSDFPCRPKPLAATTGPWPWNAVRSFIRSSSGRNGPASTPTNRIASCRMAISRSVPPRPGITGYWSTKRSPRRASLSRSSPSARNRSRRTERGWSQKPKAGNCRDGSSAHGWAAEIPPGPQDSNEPLEDLTLIPYGCTNIRVTEFPRLKK